jgi:hypothetical protein
VNPVNANSGETKANDDSAKNEKEAEKDKGEIKGSLSVSSDSSQARKFMNHRKQSDISP